MLWDALWYINKSGHDLIFQGANFNTLVKIELAMEAWVQWKMEDPLVSRWAPQFWVKGCHKR